jgi:hypothetical protein
MYYKKNKKLQEKKDSRDSVEKFYDWVAARRFKLMIYCWLVWASGVMFIMLYLQNVNNALEDRNNQLLDIIETTNSGK